MLPPARRHWRVFAFLALLATAFVGGCEDAGQAGVTLRFWAMGSEGEVVQALLPAFQRRNPDVHVRVQQIPWSAAHEKLLTAFAGDAMPDVFQLGSTWLAEFVALRAVQPLDTRLRASTAIDLDDYFPGVLAGGRQDSVTYAMPWYADTRVLFYRRDLLAAAGVAGPLRGRAAWREALERVRARGTGGYPLLLPITEWEPLVVLALENGAPLLRDGDRYGAFSEPRFRAALSEYVGLFRDGLAPAPGAAETGNLYRDFAAGRFAVFLSGPWNLAALRQRMPASLAGAWTTAPLPGDADGRPGISIAGGASLAIASSSRHADAAWRLIEFLSEPAQQLALYRLAGDLPARRSPWSDPLLAGDEQARAFLLQLGAVRPPPQIPEWERIAAAIVRHAEAVVRGSAGIDESLRALDRDADTLLEKRRWMLEQLAARPARLADPAAAQAARR